MGLHRRTHPVDVPGCFGCKALGVSVAPTAVGSVEAQRVRRSDAQLSKDLDAYKRLRRDGLQPPRVDGSADREARAGAAHEVESKPDPKLFERVLG